MNLDISNLHISALTIIGIATLLGFYFGRAAKLVKLPSIIGYMVLGVLLGPSVLNLFTEHTMESVSFITSIALGLVAFSIGAELNMASLRHLGWGIISIILSESLIAFGLVTAAIFVDKRYAVIAGFRGYGSCQRTSGNSCCNTGIQGKGQSDKSTLRGSGF
jgi:Kef-type K+ transport system membrane component KefB